MSRSTAGSPLLQYVRRGRGEPIVLIHGIGSESCIWEPVLDPLADGHDVIALDLPGFGGSRPLADGEAPTPAALARAVATLLDDLGIDTAHAVGNSLGGWVALELARATRARSVVGLCPAGFWGAPMATGAAAVRGRAHRLVRAFRPVIPALLVSRRLRHLALTPFVAHPERVPYHAAWRMIRSYGRATAYDATATAMRQNFFSDATGISVPVTIAFGERDRLIRPSRVRIPGAQTIVLPGCGHIPMWDDPGLVTAVIEETIAAAPAEAPAPRAAGLRRP